MKECTYCENWNEGKGTYYCIRHCSHWTRSPKKRSSIKVPPSSFIEQMYADKRDVVTILSALTKLEPVCALSILGRYLLNMKDHDLASSLKVNRRTIQRYLNCGRVDLSDQGIGIPEKKKAAVAM